MEIGRVAALPWAAHDHSVDIVIRIIGKWKAGPPYFEMPRPGVYEDPEAFGFLHRRALKRPSVGSVPRHFNLGPERSTDECANDKNV